MNDRPVTPLLDQVIAADKSEYTFELKVDPRASASEMTAAIKAGDTAPDFSMTTIEGTAFKLADLRGKVVVLDFWTYGCINCIHVIPSMREWHNTYNDDGLVIIGVHTPEFSFEHDLNNVEEALVRLDVPYAVAIDNDWQTWRDYKKPFNQRYWPAKYFIDKAGNVRHIHIGEGRYEQQEKIIQALLAEDI